MRNYIDPTGDPKKAWSEIIQDTQVLKNANRQLSSLSSQTGLDKNTINNILFQTELEIRDKELRKDLLTMNENQVRKIGQVVTGIDNAASEISATIERISENQISALQQNHDELMSEFYYLGYGMFSRLDSINSTLQDVISGFDNLIEATLLPDRYKEAIQFYKEGLKSKHLGAFDNRYYDEAYKCFLTALEIYEARSEFHFHIAEIMFFSLKHLNIIEGPKHLERAIFLSRHRSEQINIYKNSVILYARFSFLNKSYEDSLKIILEFESLNKEDPGVSYNKILLLTFLLKYEEAKQAINEAIKNNGSMLLSLYQESNFADFPIIANFISDKIEILIYDIIKAVDELKIRLNYKRWGDETKVVYAEFKEIETTINEYDKSFSYAINELKTNSYRDLSLKASKFKSLFEKDLDSFTEKLLAAQSKLKSERRNRLILNIGAGKPQKKPLPSLKDFFQEFKITFWRPLDSEQILVPIILFVILIISAIVNIIWISPGRLVGATTWMLFKFELFLPIFSTFGVWFSAALCSSLFNLYELKNLSLGRFLFLSLLTLLTGIFLLNSSIGSGSSTIEAISSNVFMESFFATFLPSVVILIGQSFLLMKG